MEGVEEGDLAADAVGVTVGLNVGVGAGGDTVCEGELVLLQVPEVVAVAEPDRCVAVKEVGVEVGVRVPEGVGGEREGEGVALAVTLALADAELEWVALGVMAVVDVRDCDAEHDADGGDGEREGVGVRVQLGDIDGLKLQDAESVSEGRAVGLRVQVTVLGLREGPLPEGVDVEEQEPVQEAVGLEDRVREPVLLGLRLRLRVRVNDTDSGTERETVGVWLGVGLGLEVPELLDVTVGRWVWLAECVAVSVPEHV